MKYIFLLLIGLIYFGCPAQLKCENFKTGKFRLDDKKLKFESVIERNDSIQIEKSATTKTESKFKITWKNPCQYSLDLIASNDKYANAFKGKILNVKIIATEEDQYTFEAWIDGIDFISTQTVKRIK